MSTLLQISLIVFIISCSLAIPVTNPCRRESNKSKQFLPHPDSKTKFIQCTKRGEMFEFDCETGLEWDSVESKCIDLEQETKPLVFNSRTRNLNAKSQGVKIKPKMNGVILTTTTLTTPIQTSTFTTTQSILFTTPTMQSVITPELTIDEEEDKIIIKTIQQQEMASRREQELLLNQIKKQQELVKESVAMQNELVHQHKQDDEIKLMQQIEQQKAILKDKFIQMKPQQQVSQTTSAQEIQKMIHEHEKNEQFRQLNTLRLQQQETINKKKIDDKQHLDDQLIIQQILQFNHLDHLQGALHKKE